MGQTQADGRSFFVGNAFCRNGGRMFRAVKAGLRPALLTRAPWGSRQSYVSPSVTVLYAEAGGCTANGNAHVSRTNRKSSFSRWRGALRLRA